MAFRFAYVFKDSVVAFNPLRLFVPCSVHGGRHAHAARLLLVRVVTMYVT
jgi:hypothetical protein